MLKKFSVLALAGMLCLPSLAAAGGGAADLGAQIDDLQRQIEQLKKQITEMEKQKAAAPKMAAPQMMRDEELEERVTELEERSESWDLASRFHWSGDFRSRYDFVAADTATSYKALDVGQGVSDFYTLNTDFQAAAATALAASADSGADFQAATIGDILAAFAAGGVPTGTATANALTDLNNTLGGLSATQQAAMFAVLPALSPALTMAQVSGAFSTTFADQTNIQPVVAFMKTFTPAQRAAIFSALGYSPQQGRNIDNDSIMTNRLRLNLRAKATENVEFKGRLAMYKIWGMQNNAVDQTFNNGLGGGPFMLSSLAFDGSRTRQPDDNSLYVDRAFMNWNNIAGLPVWFSVGRRPTTDGPPAQLRMGADQRLATPVGFMDYPFDGATIGYAYMGLPGLSDFPGRIRFCYGRGFENGPTENGGNFMGKDTDFAGINWDVYKKGDRFLNVQSFGAFDIFNVPDNVTFGNPIEFAFFLADPSYYDPTDPSHDLILNRQSLGNIWHNSFVYMDKVENLNYFLAGGWSRTVPNGVDELGTSLLGSFYEDPDGKDGFAVYTGVRYDMDDYNLKLGLEYNYGSKNWISFTPGHDDLYASKLATRGHVVEVYGIWDIPAGEAVSKYGRAFIRAGYMHYQYNYTGSGFWLGEPIDIDELANDPLSAQFWEPADSIDQVYVSLEAWF